MRVRADDPEYRREAAAEAEFWRRIQPASIEAGELREWRRRRPRSTTTSASPETRASRGRRPSAATARIRRGLVLGTSFLRDEACLLTENSALEVTFVDISAGALARPEEALGRQFRGRDVSMRTPV
jgi:hypothetical protein